MFRREAVVIAISMGCVAQQSPAQTDFIGPRLAGRVFTPQIELHQRRPRDPDPEDRAADSQQSLRFQPSAERRRASYASFVEETRRVDPKGAANLERTLQADPIAMMGPELAKSGLRIDDVADAYTVYWVEAWQAAHGRSEQTSRETAQAVRKQAAAAMAPAVVTASDAQKQDFAEALLIQALLIGAAREQAAGDVGILRQIAASVRQGANASGLDLDAMTLTAQGFVPAKKGVSDQPADAGSRDAGQIERTVAGRSSGEDDLVAALAAIPAEARPIKVVSHGQGSYVGWPASYVYTVSTYLLFSNGWMSLCADWDPGKLRPTPESLGRAYPDCGLRRWRRSGSGFEMQEDDGNWVALTDTADDLRSFKPGEMLELAFGNVSGVGFSGAVSVNTISGSDLRMTSGGEIAVGSWSSAVLSGSNLGGGSSSRGEPLIGRYRLDGNIIAVRTAAGAISRGFIAGVPAAGRPEYIYLNGKQFWKGD